MLSHSCAGREAAPALTSACAGRGCEPWSPSALAPRAPHFPAPHACSCVKQLFYSSKCHQLHSSLRNRAAEMEVPQKKQQKFLGLVLSEKKRGMYPCEPSPGVPSVPSQASLLPPSPGMPTATTFTLQVQTPSCAAFLDIFSSSFTCLKGCDGEATMGEEESPP